MIWLWCELFVCACVCCVCVCFHVCGLGSENKSVVLASTAIQLLDERKSPIAAGKWGLKWLFPSLTHTHFYIDRGCNILFLTLLCKLCFPGLQLSAPTSFPLFELKHSLPTYTDCAAFFVHALAPAWMYAQRKARAQHCTDVCIQEYLCLNILIEASFTNAFCALVFCLCAYLRHIVA